MGSEEQDFVRGGNECSTEHAFDAQTSEYVLYEQLGIPKLCAKLGAISAVPWLLDRISCHWEEISSGASTMRLSKMFVGSYNPSFFPTVSRPFSFPALGHDCLVNRQNPAGLA